MFTAPVIRQSHIGNMAVGYSEVKGLGVLNEKHEAALLPALFLLYYHRR